MIGIKGAGMAALAEIFMKNGTRVTGSDTGEVFFTDRVLGSIGIAPIAGFAPDNIPSDTDLVIYSTAYMRETNAELEAAFSKDIPVLPYPEAIGEITKEKMGLLVTGTHGKTTTSALLAEALRVAGLDPTAIIGSRVRNWKGNALAGDGEYFVLEADEYQNKLRHYHPFAVILTSIDWDHPDFFPDFESYKNAFKEFVRRIPRHGILVYCNDSAAVAEIAAEATCEKRSYGFHEQSDFFVKGYEPKPLEGADPDGEKQSFEILSGWNSLGSFSLRLAGRHNAQNAAAVVALASFLKLDMDRIREGLASFPGTERRFEYVGERNGALVYDDYAHHPEELMATIDAFRDLYPDRRLTAVFHPHTFSRTEALLSEFSQSFDGADRVVALDVYGSAREKGGSVSSADLVREINRYAPGKAEHIGTVDEAVAELSKTVGKGDLVVTFGAGNVWEVAKKLVGPEDSSPKT
jgi:UDP-N-acetylmuramate--alanine ligase